MNEHVIVRGVGTEHLDDGLHGVTTASMQQVEQAILSTHARRRSLQAMVVVRPRGRGVFAQKVDKRLVQWWQSVGIKVFSTTVCVQVDGHPVFALSIVWVGVTDVTTGEVSNRSW